MYLNTFESVLSRLWF